MRPRSGGGLCRGTLGSGGGGRCPASAIEPAGFAPEEALLPWPARSFAGFRLLTEYFAFPEKFLFVDFTRLDAKTLLSDGNRLEIFVYLDRALPELERTIGADTLALGCTPVVNLFPQRCEPIPLTHTDIEYRIVPDARRPAAMEVWQVERVRETAAGRQFAAVAALLPPDARRSRQRRRGRLLPCSHGDRPRRR